jgi:hypothetical protein
VVKQSTKKSPVQQLLAGSSFNEQIQENLNKSDFGFCALSQQLLFTEIVVHFYFILTFLLNARLKI